MSLPSNGEWHPLWVSNIRYVFQTRNRNFLKEVSGAIKLGDHDAAFLSLCPICCLPRMLMFAKPINVVVTPKFPALTSSLSLDIDTQPSS